MAIYTLTTNLIENIQLSERSIFSSLFHMLTNVKSGNKLAIDKNKRLLTIYAEANVIIGLKYDYKYWLDYLSDKHIYDIICEPIPVEIDISDKDQAFLDVASAINGSKKIIVYSRNNNCPYQCDGKNEVEHNGEKICVLDKDEAVSEINDKNNITNITTYGDNSPVINGNNNKVKTNYQNNE